MHCPECGGKGRVISTFTYPTVIQRYHRCRACQARYRTWEECDRKPVRPQGAYGKAVGYEKRPALPAP